MLALLPDEHSSAWVCKSSEEGVREVASKEKVVPKKVVPAGDEALRADLAHTSARASDLSAEVERLRRDTKRIQRAEEAQEKAEEELADVKKKLAKALAQVSSLQSDLEALSDNNAKLQARADAYRAIKSALNTS